MKNNEKGMAYFYCVLAMIGWGSMFVACKLAYEVVSGMTLLFIRYLLAVAILLIIYRRRSRPKLSCRNKMNVILIGVLGYCLSIAFQMVGTDYLNASMASIINTMTPVAIIVFAIWILREKSSLIQLVGIGITIVGAVVIIGAKTEGNLLIGIVLSIVGMLLWGLTSVLIRKMCSDIDPVWLTIYAMAVAMIVDIPIMRVEIYSVGIEMDNMSFMAVLAMVWIGVVPTALANLTWSKALEVLPAATCSLFYAFLPVVTSLLGVALLGEKMTMNFIIGCLIVILGVVVAILAERKQEKA